MPVFIHVNYKQEPLFCRGQKFRLWRRVKLWLGLPFRLRSYQTEDVFVIPARSVSYIQAFSDEEFNRRKAKREAEIEAAKKARDEATKKNPNPGGEPKHTIPSPKK